MKKLKKNPIGRINIDLQIGFGSLDLFANNEVNTKYLGKYRSKYKGRGLEFDSYRNFDQDNDDAVMIDQLASARSGKPMVRQFVEERNQDVFFLIDVSNSMLLSSQPKLKCEYAAELVAALSSVILKANDNIGYALFNEQIVHLNPPAKGMNAYYTLIDVLSKAENYGGNFNLKLALDTILEILPENSLVILVSDFIGLQPRWEESLGLIASKYSLIGMMVRDPIDRMIPKGIGQVAITDPYSDENMLIDPNEIKPYYEMMVKKEEKEIEKQFTYLKSELLLLQTDEPFVDKVTGLFKLWGKRWK